MSGDGERGFTLLEVLVALVVTSLVLGIVMNGAANARQRLRANQERQQAAILGRALAATEVAAPFRAGDRAGREAGLVWQVHERAVVSDPRGFFVLSQIFLTVDNERGARLLEAEARRIKAIDQ